MGLDNYPDEYPCIARGVAVYKPQTDKDGQPLYHSDGTVKKQFSCQLTQEAGACPWKNHPTRPAEGAVYGMLGTDCWYRGKYGTYLLEALDVDNESFLYGDESYRIGEEELRTMSKFILDRLDEVVDAAGKFIHEGEDRAPDIKYLSWWLEFMADESGTVIAWF